jgi:hypothetical protein
MLEEEVLNVVAGVGILLLTDMMDVLHQPTAQMSMDAQFVFVMIIGQSDHQHPPEETSTVVMNTFRVAETPMRAVIGVEVDLHMVIEMMEDIEREVSVLEDVRLLRMQTFRFPVETLEMFQTFRSS